MWLQFASHYTVRIKAEFVTQAEILWLFMSAVPMVFSLALAVATFVKPSACTFQSMGSLFLYLFQKITNF